MELGQPSGLGYHTGLDASFSGSTAPALFGLDTDGQNFTHFSALIFSYVGSARLGGSCGTGWQSKGVTWRSM